MKIELYFSFFFQLVGYPKKPVPYIADIPTLQVDGGMITKESLQVLLKIFIMHKLNKLLLNKSRLCLFY